MRTNAIQRIEELLSYQDPSYRDFQCRLMPTIDSNTVIGVRTPILRKFAHSLQNTPEAQHFLSDLPHTYYEENNLHAFLIEKIPSFPECLAALERFLPYINNWATCDSISPPVFQKHLPELQTSIQTWLQSSHTYTIRFAIRMLMRFYLEDTTFQPMYFDCVASVSSNEYYVKMMIAWYFSTALAKQYMPTLHFLQKSSLDSWTHNKTIQKALESHRLTKEQKACLRGMKR